jgi:hypothetical protein
MGSGLRTALTKKTAGSIERIERLTHPEQQGRAYSAGANAMRVRAGIRAAKAAGRREEAS